MQSNELLLADKTQNSNWNISSSKPCSAKVQKNLYYSFKYSFTSYNNFFPVIGTLNCYNLLPSLLAVCLLWAHRVVKSCKICVLFRMCFINCLESSIPMVQENVANAVNNIVKYFCRPESVGEVSLVHRGRLKIRFISIARPLSSLYILFCRGVT